MSTGSLIPDDTVCEIVGIKISSRSFGPVTHTHVYYNMMYRGAYTSHAIKDSH